MSLEKRADNKCELCKSQESLSRYELVENATDEKSVLVCKVCKEQIEDSSTMDENHFRCLNDSMWSEHPAVVVMSYRVLKRLGRQDLLDMIYMEDDVKEWADEAEAKEETRDSNGTVLSAGDTVTIIKDLEVKGAGFTAKRGTAVRNIALTNNPDQIEGRVNGTRIVLLSKFLKKS